MPPTSGLNEPVFVPEVRVHGVGDIEDQGAFFSLVLYSTVRVYDGSTAEHYSNIVAARLLIGADVIEQIAAEAAQLLCGRRLLS